MIYSSHMWPPHRMVCYNDKQIPVGAVLEPPCCCLARTLCQFLSYVNALSGLPIHLWHRVTPMTTFG